MRSIVHTLSALALAATVSRAERASSPSSPSSADPPLLRVVTGATSDTIRSLLSESAARVPRIHFRRDASTTTTRGAGAAFAAVLDGSQARRLSSAGLSVRTAAASEKVRHFSLGGGAVAAGGTSLRIQVRTAGNERDGAEKIVGALLGGESEGETPGAVLLRGTGWRVVEAAVEVADDEYAVRAEIVNDGGHTTASAGVQMLLREALERIAALDSSVVSVGPARATSAVPFLANAKWIIQETAGAADGARPMPVTARLDGKGQVIAVADSGVDTNHCMFVDPANPDPPVGTLDRTRRKIVYYEVAADQTPGDAMGHGTAIANAVAGLPAPGSVPSGPLANATLNSGIAGENAKLAVYQLESDGKGGFALPSMLTLLSWADDSADAGVLCAALGTKDGPDGYDANEEDIDRYLVETSEYLTVVTAAGNLGAHTTVGGGMRQTASPGNAKNVISVGAACNAAVPPGDTVSQDRLAAFSSAGPAPDGRIKPDLVAPGQGVVTAQMTQDSTCAFAAIEGTSVAAAVVAGAASLVRGYLMDGWHPTGTPVPSDAVTPSAALVKAVLINGARTLTEEVTRGSDPIDPSAGGLPNAYQGFGEVDLGMSLSFATTSPDRAEPPSKFALTAVDDIEVEAGGEPYTICVEVPDGGHGLSSDPTGIRATIAWSDPPSDGTAKMQLVNDVDLRVVSPSGSDVLLGNGPVFGEGTDEGPIPDAINNVERVVVDGPLEAGTWKIVVYPRSIPSGKQRVALAVTAPNGAVEYDNSPDGKKVPRACPVPTTCPGGCSGHGKCITGGVCDCDPGFFGIDCMGTAAKLSLDTPATALIDEHNWRYFAIDLDDSAATLKSIDIKVESMGQSPAGESDPGLDPDLYLREGALPTLREFDAEDRVTTTAGDGSGTHLALLRNQGVQPGKTYYIGVFAHCCAPKMVLRVTVTGGSDTPSPEPLPSPSPSSSGDSSSSSDGSSSSSSSGDSSSGETPEERSRRRKREATAAILGAIGAVCVVAGALVWMKLGRPGRKAGKGNAAQLDYALMGGGDETL